jgi:SAM-dependent methyltransferase
MKINISDIKINHRKRDADPHKVRQLADSIEKIGLLNPITISTKKQLVAGLHRIRAYQLLGKKRIEAIVKDFDEMRQELGEIDENICRAELNIIEKGELLLRRDELLTDLGVRAKHGRQKGAYSTPFTTAQIAKEAGMGERTSQRYKQIARSLDKGVKDKLRDTPFANSPYSLLQLAHNSTTIQKIAVKKILNNEARGGINFDVDELSITKRAIELANMELKIREFNRKAKGFKLPESITLHCADYRDIEIAQNSIDLVITDPYYKREAIHTFKDLGQYVYRVLKPSGFFIFYISGMYIPVAINLCVESGLRYYWLGVIKFKKGRNKILTTRVNNYIRHFVIMYKPPVNPRANFFNDCIEDNGKEKDFHLYQQNLKSFEYLISRFSDVGDTLLDPQCGAGTCVIAALNQKRKVIGIDRDSKALKTSKARIAALV